MKRNSIDTVDLAEPALQGRHPDAAPARPVGRPRSAAAHAAILEAAIALTRELGYDAVTMDGIATRAGVSKATIYRRWADKEALVAEAVSAEVKAVPLPDTGRTEDDLRILMASALEMYEDPATAALLTGLLAAVARSATIAHSVRSGFVATWRDAMRQVLARGIDRNELRGDFDIDLAVDLLGGPLFHRYLLTSGQLDEKLAAQVVDVALRGLAPAR